MTTKRLKYLDYAKGFGIALVVYGHVLRGLVKANIPFNETLSLFSDNMVYFFHMPLFFFIAGIFLLQSFDKAPHLKVFIAKKAKLILYPYFVWSILQTTIEIIMSKYTNGSVNSSALIEILYHPRAQFWFLYELFKMFVICGLIFSITNKWRVHICLAIALILLLIEKITGFKIVHEYFIYFIAGMSFYTLWIRRGKYTEHKAILALLFTSIFCITSYFIIANNLQQYFIFQLLLATCGIAMTCLISTVIAEKNLFGWIEYIGQLSMPIYLAHIIAASGIRIILKLIGITSPYIHLPIGLLGGILLPIIAYHLSKKLGLLIAFEFPKKNNS